jgi:hypothetical protein
LNHVYLLALRVGEVCGCKVETDPNKPTGHTLRAERGTYQPDHTVREELDNLAFLMHAQRLREGDTTAPALKDIWFFVKTGGWYQ